MSLPPSFRALGSNSPQPWHDLQSWDEPLSSQDWMALLDAFRVTTGQDVQLVAVQALVTMLIERQILGLNGKRFLSTALFGPFTKKSALIAINEHQQPRDVFPFQDVMKLLAREPYGRTTFHHVAMTKPDWTKVHLHDQTAVGFIGRRTMFKDCDLLKEVPESLRFSLPPDDQNSPGTFPSREFHHVRQDRRGAPERRFETTQASVRSDYAVIQRFSVPFGINPEVVVLLIQGASSLGTTGAARWLLEGCEQLTLPSALAINDETRFEILLNVVSQVHEPPQLWEPTVHAKKIFIDDLKFARGSDGCLHLDKPSDVTVGLTRDRPGEASVILFGDDDVLSRPTRPIDRATRAALSALCLKALRTEKNANGRRVISVADLVNDQSLWSDEGFRPKNVQLTQWFADHVKPLFGETLIISRKTSELELCCDIVAMDV